MPEGEDWLMRPVLEHMIKYESLGDGSLNICDIAILNDAIDVRDENTRRVRAAQEANHGRV
jgi:hypothetical protein